MSDFAQCACGAYCAVVIVDGRKHWAAGCRACDELERLRTLLEGEVIVRDGKLQPLQVADELRHASTTLKGARKKLVLKAARTLEELRGQVLNEAAEVARLKQQEGLTRQRIIDLQNQVEQLSEGKNEDR